METNKTSNQEIRSFNVTVDGVGYAIESTPFQFNDQVRYSIRVNGGEPAVFVWNDEMTMFQSLQDNTSVYPDGLMRAINDELLKTPGH